MQNTEIKYYHNKKDEDKLRLVIKDSLDIGLTQEGDSPIAVYSASVDFTDSKRTKTARASVEVPDIDEETSKKLNQKTRDEYEKTIHDSVVSTLVNRVYVELKKMIKKGQLQESVRIVNVN